MELTIQDLMRFYCCTEKTARQRKTEILSFFKLPFKNRRPLLIHLAIYEGLSIDIVRTTLFE